MRKTATEIVIGDRIGSKAWEVVSIDTTTYKYLVVFNAGTEHEITATRGARILVS